MVKLHRFHKTIDRRRKTVFLYSAKNARRSKGNEELSLKTMTVHKPISLFPL
jgi:hypothetical protein